MLETLLVERGADERVGMGNVGSGAACTDRVRRQKMYGLITRRGGHTLRTTRAKPIPGLHFAGINGGMTAPRSSPFAMWLPPDGAMANIAMTTRSRACMDEQRFPVCDVALLN